MIAGRGREGGVNVGLFVALLSVSVAGDSDKEE